VCNYREEIHGVLVSPPHSTRVYREPAVEQAFMLLLILVALGELFSSPAIALADGYTLTVLADQTKEVRKLINLTKKYVLFNYNFFCVTINSLYSSHYFSSEKQDSLEASDGLLRC
jgi:hypothetical protein